jgi:hypothetical protein
MDQRKTSLLSSGDIFRQIGLQAKLVLHLMGDKRVNFWLKLVPIFAVIYAILPDLAIGPFDDGAILWLSSYLITTLSPQDVVEQYRQELWNTIPGEWHDSDESDVIDADFKDSK